ncbi:unnamed protein product [Didymodactylos carnosus]|uniref:Uncharacterized protein n=1 Tax=Didymodactylos carnosus TaxID=1234261 RepID=A0A815TTB8_9BILA|nr:unnamed protein product [Didymodactylos carnosus]CAF4371753.1 unnamed protein product [Didymodactylos carnosus]
MDRNVNYTSNIRSSKQQDIKLWASEQPIDSEKSATVAVAEKTDIIIPAPAPLLTTAVAITAATSDPHTILKMKNRELQPVEKDQNLMQFFTDFRIEVREIESKFIARYSKAKLPSYSPVLSNGHMEHAQSLPLFGMKEDRRNIEFVCSIERRTF